MCLCHTVSIIFAVQIEETGGVSRYSGNQITERIKEKQRFKPWRVPRALRIKVSVIALLILSIVIVSLLIAWY